MTPRPVLPVPEKNRLLTRHLTDTTKRVITTQGRLIKVITKHLDVSEQTKNGESELSLVGRNHENGKKRAMEGRNG